MTETVFYPRYVERRLTEALEDSPVVLIHGPRQCGKTTLAQMVCAPKHLTLNGDTLTLDGHPLSVLAARPRDYTYISFDDDVVRVGAEDDPMGFVADLPERVILDEVQRVPRLFTALKMEVDRKRVPGRFVLTGSTNVLLIPKLSDSLAGRMEMVRLHPLTQCELASGAKSGFTLDMRSGFLDALFGGRFKFRRVGRLGNQLIERIVAGGYPAALVRPAGRRRANWYRDKDQMEVDIVIERSAMSVAGIEVKAAATLKRSDFRGLRKLKKVTGSRFAGGVVLYDGETCLSFGEGLYAVPLRLLWETPMKIA